ncbi:1-acyl-sn-glycerol-3-phosphate acyltransferase [Bacteroidales bacterium AH-315-I05]|nr:1-acyl-sn-glycerol-3-phosphate acyltransferase [Bacteroidales bacterium AH-315-I05]
MRFYRLLYKFILSRRYNVEIIGVNLLKSKGGKLILPNHQSHIDPQIIAIETFKYAEIVPVVSERFFKIPVVNFFLKEWGAVSVSDLRTGKRDVSVLDTITSQVAEALKEGRNVIIYPSGELASSGVERIRNKQSAYALVKQIPDNVRVIGVRISGLWGSMWSKAWDGTKPVFLTTYLKGIFYFFANFIFFSPKRKVTMEFIDITDEAIEQAKNDRKIFNTFLEEFYNVNGEEKPTYIKHLFYFPKLKKELPEQIQKN